jgi:hypothetical protein
VHDGVYDEVKMTVPMVVRYVHSYSKENVTCVSLAVLSTDLGSSLPRFAPTSLFFTSL